MIDYDDDKKWKSIKDYFRKHPEFGKIRSGEPGKRPEHKGQYLIRCTYERCYVVSMQSDDDFSVEPHDLPTGEGVSPSF